jgi:hypothetical protein
VGYQGDRIGPEVAAISGAEALSRTDTIWVQAGVLLDAHLDVTTLVAPR